MANNFRNFQVLNVATGAGSTLYTVPASTQSIVVGLLVANKTAVNVTVTVNLATGVTTALISGVIVPPNSTLVVIGKDEKLVMEAADVLTVIAGTATSLDATASVLEVTP